MPLIAYKKNRLKPEALATIMRVNEVLEEYAADGIDLTVRQVYYQFVARNWIANTQRDYKNLAGIIDSGRMCGLIDWNRIQDRTRFLRHITAWDTPAEIIRGAAAQYKEDLWKTQPLRIEVWIEKDAGVGNIESTCQLERVPFLSCRGYTSQSEMWRAAQRLKEYVEAGQEVHILHLGDHDPSGIDMSRDIRDRLEMFMGADSAHLDIHRLALNMDQVNEHNPPPNPAKTTDSRSAKYIGEFGNDSWELDALNPRIVRALISNFIAEHRDMDKWEEAQAGEDHHKSELKKISKHYEKVAEFVRRKKE